MVAVELLMELTEVIQRAVLPHLDSESGRQLAGTAQSGDATFGIDEVAERAAAEFISERLSGAAYYTEDRGLRVPEDGSEDLLVIDPIDGSRPARAGLESCVVSVASAPYTQNASLGDVEFGVVRGLRDGTLFVSERGAGVRFFRDGRPSGVRLRQTRAVSEMAWTAEFVGRPARAVMEVLWPLIDASALAGGFFILNSTAYSLTRLVSGQLDAVVDVGGRLLAELPDLRNEFVGASRGKVVALFPYDIAAGLPIALEAGCVVTDAWGRSLGSSPLLDNSESNLQTVVAATNAELHRVILSEIDGGFDRLKTRAAAGF